MIKYILVLLLLSVATTKTGYAYIDPGTGSIMIQAIAGLLLAGVFTFKLWAGKVKDFFNRKSKVPTDDEK